MSVVQEKRSTEVPMAHAINLYDIASYIGEPRIISRPYLYIKDPHFVQGMPNVSSELVFATVIPDENVFQTGIFLLDKDREVMTQEGVVNFKPSEYGFDPDDEPCAASPYYDAEQEEFGLVVHSRFRHRQGRIVRYTSSNGVDFEFAGELVGSQQITQYLDSARQQGKPFNRHLIPYDVNLVMPGMIIYSAVNGFTEGFDGRPTESDYYISMSNNPGSMDGKWSIVDKVNVAGLFPHSEQWVKEAPGLKVVPQIKNGVIVGMQSHLDGVGFREAPLGSQQYRFKAVSDHVFGEYEPYGFYTMNKIAEAGHGDTKIDPFSGKVIDLHQYCENLGPFNRMQVVEYDMNYVPLLKNG